MSPIKWVANDNLVFGAKQTKVQRDRSSTGETIVSTTQVLWATNTSTTEAEKTKTRKKLVAIKVRLLNEHAMMPARETRQAVGLDLFASRDQIIKAKGRAKINTGIAMQTPKGTYGKVESRSSMAMKFKVDVESGVVNSGYSWEVVVGLSNHSEQDRRIWMVIKIAQIIFHKIHSNDPQQNLTLYPSGRGAGAFYSTNKRGHEIEVDRPVERLLIRLKKIREYRCASIAVDSQRPAT